MIPGDAGATISPRLYPVGQASHRNGTPAGRKLDEYAEGGLYGRRELTLKCEQEKSERRGTDNGLPYRKCGLTLPRQAVLARLVLDCWWL